MDPKATIKKLNNLSLNAENILYTLKLLVRERLHLVCCQKILV